jgi:hypothetical protein
MKTLEWEDHINELCMDINIWDLNGFLKFLAFIFFCSCLFACYYYI